VIIDFSSRPPVASLTPSSPSHLRNYRRVYAASESLVGHDVGEAPLKDYLATYDALDARAVVLKGRDLETTFGMRIANEDVAQFCREHGPRYIGFAGVDPNKGMTAVRDLEHAVRELGLRGLNLQCFELKLAINDKRMYPLYAKCVELDLPLSINTGLPGPPVPGECQDPIHLDKVCFRFPELKLCMAHGADPWWGLAIRLMLKYANLHLITSAWSPKRLPPELLHFMRTRGQNKVIWASDHPALTIQRTLPAAWELDLPADVLDKYLYGNAARLFFSERKPRY
jgi:predicted TIM-barrel fold metal-dependent hydrolase